MHTRFDTESRIAVTQAADIARELGHREVGPDHLLAGLLANPRGTAYAALRRHGLEYAAVRELVATHHVDPSADEATSTEGTDAETDKNADTDAYDDDRDALRAIGIDLDRVRDTVRANLGADLAQGWGDRPERESRRDRSRRRDQDRGRTRGRGRGRHHESRGRRGPRSRRSDAPFSPALRAVLREVRRSVLHDQPEPDSREDLRRVPGMTGARLLVALTRSDDPGVRAVLATCPDVALLRADAEAATSAATSTSQEA
jgi:hypothetical protein